MNVSLSMPRLRLVNGLLLAALLAVPVVALAQTATDGQLIISEFRVRGPSGANDEFIEIYNAIGAAHTVTAASGTGYGIAGSDGTTRCSIPNGTVIPAGGHYLCVNSVAYSIGSYPAGAGATATGDATYATDIPDNAGIAIFNNNTGGASYSLANRLDAVGSTSEANTTYKEGTAYPALTPFSIDYSFYRNYDVVTGLPTDTGNNAADFVFVDTNGTSAGAGQRLGAPGPENLSSPRAAGSCIAIELLDGAADPSAAPNRVHDLTSDPANNSTFGTVRMRRKITNNCGVSVDRLRFRITDITAFPSPSGTMDLRHRSSVTEAGVATSGGPVTVEGLTVEAPPSQPNGGAFNSSWGATTITAGAPLAAGASLNVSFLVGIQQSGTGDLSVVPEASAGSAAMPTVLGAGTDLVPVELMSFSAE